MTVTELQDLADDARVGLTSRGWPKSVCERLLTAIENTATPKPPRVTPDGVLIFLAACLAAGALIGVR